MYRILTINPGSTSTKLAVYHDDTEALSQNLSHSAEELAPFATIIEQLDYRLEKSRNFWQPTSFPHATLTPSSDAAVCSNR